ncbi:MAG: signal peptidase I [Legionellales bacterium]|mgnify:CR=1 FL=1|nr:signal peptidase I [Legionellales bacterium]|tara:strand:- start:26 stop:1051 length:1026 start_codon:yes stop_codon:yes gene_type:complete
MDIFSIVLTLTTAGMIMLIMSTIDHAIYWPKRLSQNLPTPTWIEGLPYYSMLALSTSVFYYTSADHVITLWACVFGCITLLDKLYFFKTRLSHFPNMKASTYKQASQDSQFGQDYLNQTSPWIKLSHEFFVSTFVLWLLISFFVHPYRVPTGSLQPTIDPGDMLIAKKWSYGIRMPLSNHLIWSWNGQPKRGDIAIFSDPSTDSYRTLVKRVIGLPGDKISYIDKQLTINDQPVEVNSLGIEYNFDHAGQLETVIRKVESLPNKTHEIFVKPSANDKQVIDLVVPDGHYFMMGDNRDASSDSRYFGPVPFDKIGGQAWLIWMSIDPYSWKIRWDRIGINLT